ncbi:MAG TPA: hypothetical protein VM681_09705 [Candidatus Thermoplasmatota archaeon]|nr:hypothetical protein [Candidatus Thermoplasmatota archaeon]
MGSLFVPALLLSTLAASAAAGSPLSIVAGWLAVAAILFAEALRARPHRWLSFAPAALAIAPLVALLLGAGLVLDFEPGSPARFRVPALLPLGWLGFAPGVLLRATLAGPTRRASFAATSLGALALLAVGLAWGASPVDSLPPGSGLPLAIAASLTPAAWACAAVVLLHELVGGLRPRTHRASRASNA